MFRFLRSSSDVTRGTKAHEMGMECDPTEKMRCAGRAGSFAFSNQTQSIAKKAGILGFVGLE